MPAVLMAYHHHQKRSFEDSPLQSEAFPACPVKRPRVDLDLHNGVPGSPSLHPHLAAIPEEPGTRQRITINAMDTSLPTASLFNGTATSQATYPDVIELPPNDEEAMLDEEPNESSDADDLWESEHPHKHRQQLSEGNNNQNNIRVVLPPNFARSIPSVLLETPTRPVLPFEERTGPIIEEVPYNPLALVPYSPRPEILFPPNSPLRDNACEEERSQPYHGGGVCQEEESEDGSMEVIPMLTPPDVAAYGGWPQQGGTAAPSSQDNDDMEMED